MQQQLTNSDGKTVEVFRLDWDGHTWHARQIAGDDTIHLSRTCTGCWATGDGYTGMWSTTRHTVEATVTQDTIDARAARIARLRAIGETEAAVALAAKAGRRH